VTRGKEDGRSAFVTKEKEGAPLTFTDRVAKARSTWRTDGEESQVDVGESKLDEVARRSRSRRE
jgi:hypothetical protein